MISVSTKTGDLGQSNLANGERLDKDSLIFEVLGTQDELNSWIGMSQCQLDDRFAQEKKYLRELQDTLFYIGAELAQSPKARLGSDQLQELEAMSDALQQKMEKDWASKFLFPGGVQAAATLDVTRTVCRRFERLVVRLSKEQELSPLILQFVNRLSDFLYVLRCYVNHLEKFSEQTFNARPPHKPASSTKS